MEPVVLTKKLYKKGPRKMLQTIQRGRMEACYQFGAISGKENQLEKLTFWSSSTHMDRVTNLHSSIVGAPR